MEKLFAFECGDKVRDLVSGLEGKIMGRSNYLTGCNRYAIVAKGLDKEGKKQEWQNFDENQLELVKSGEKLREKVKANTKEGPGGPRSRGEDTPQK